MNKSRIKDIIQYTLALASHEDDFHERKLGSIHFIKYVYLVDMEYAKYNHGETFTGIKWRFYHFGPWSNDVNAQIEPALNEIHAVKEENRSKYSEDDYIRWFFEDSCGSHLSGIESRLDLTVKSALKKYVHKFKNNTSALLHFVYATLPMLNAAPEEYLDFSVMGKAKPDFQQNAKSEFVPYLERISKKKRKNLAFKMEELRKSFQNKVSEKVLVYSTTKPKYDEIFEEGVRWLDSLAGDELPEDGATIQIDKSVWKSEARRGNDE